MLSRRQLLGASPAALPAALSGCLALSACSAPAVLKAPPAVSPQAQALLRAVSAEQDLVLLYDRVIAAHPALGTALGPLRAEHSAHLAQLRGTVIEPPGKRLPGPSASQPVLGATQARVLVQLRGAEQDAVTALMGHLAGAPPSLAQLYASIAASEATHVRVLSARMTAR